METNYPNQSLLLESRLDALEAFEAFSQARTFFFWIILLMLLSSQTLFWLVDRGVLTERKNGPDNIPVDVGNPVYRQQTIPAYVWTGFPVLAQSPPADLGGPAGPDQPAPLEDSPILTALRGRSMEQSLTCGLKLINYLAGISCLIYCFCLIVGMKLVIVANLGGLADGARAFFLSLIMLVLVLPWQTIIAPELPGTLYNWKELSSMRANAHNDNDLYTWALYFGRFAGLWLISFLLLLGVQIRSIRSVRAVRQRVRIIMATLTAQTSRPAPVRPTPASDTPIPLE